MGSRTRRITVLAVAPIAVALALAACGGSSKPGYCSDRTALEQSVKDIGSVNVLQSGGIKQLQAQLQEVETNANTLVSSAKDDFPSETSAISTSATALKAAVQGLPSSPSPTQLAAVAGAAKGFVTSFQSFKSASDSKCS